MLLRLLERRRAPFAVVALALLVTLPSLSLGFVTDDYAFRALLHAPPPYSRPTYDLFRFAGGDAALTARAIATGHTPWWTALDLRIHFIRPLTGILTALDDAVAASHPLFDHVHSIVWYLALVVAVGALYRRLFSNGATATIAMLVFAWSHALVYPYAWLAARHVLVGGLPAVVALWAHIRWREGGWRAGRWLAPMALVLGLAGSEVALGGVVFWWSFECLRAGDRSWRTRLAGCAPATTIAGIYLVAYALLHGGARASGGYHDPMNDPLGFAAVAATRLPVLLGDALFGVPAELAMVMSPARVALTGLVAVALVASTYVLTQKLASDRERAALRWLVPGAVAATILGVSGFSSGRVLLVPNVGFAALVGVLLARGFEAAPRRLLRIACVAVLALVHLVLAPLSSWRAIGKLGHRARASEAVAKRLADMAPADGRLFLVASDPYVFLYPRGILADTEPGAVRCLSTLSAARASHRITRIDDRTLSLEPIERSMLEGSFDTLFRGAGRPFEVGETIRQCGAAIRVATVDEGRPSRIEVTFDRSLDADDLVVMVWKDRHLERLRGLAIGDTTEVAWSAGPAGT